MIPVPVSIALGTLVSEDLACIAAGLLVARGDVGPATAITACVAGIFAGDILLFWLGRLFGRAAIVRAPLKWLVNDADLRRASQWISKRGAWVIFASRFLPGARLPTYVAAGVLDTSFPWFAAWFALAVAVWTPILVGISALAGAAGVERFASWQRSGALLFVMGSALIYAVTRLALRLTTWRGRRLLLSSWRRLFRFEFWPLWVVYAPVVLYALRLGIRYRGITAFTAANPAMDDGGFVGESKAAILSALARSGAPVARFRTLPASLPPAERMAMAREFLRAERLSFPVVVKPDVGERGRGVTIVESEADLAARVEQTAADLIVQEHIRGPEFGVFYYRRPGEAKGTIFSITEKRTPTVVGDGRRTLERLVLEDERGILMARFHLQHLADRLTEIPATGEEIALAETGNHCRGALFLDGSNHATPELTSAIDAIALAVDGFHFGRFDVRAESVDSFREGRNFRILELNGVASESTDIYDPKFGAVAAWKKLCEQWRLAYAIGAMNRAKGTPTVSPAGLLRRWQRARSAGQSAVVSPSIASL